jgi:hypothetical protein
MKRHLTSVLLAIGLVIALLPAATFAASVAEIENHGEALVFYPTVPYSTFIVTVTGPCNYQFRREITKGEVVFQLDSTTIDGVYRFEVVANPVIDPDLIKVLLEARAEMDEETPNQLCRDGKMPEAPLTDNSGFRVERGTIIWDPTAYEKDARSGGPTLDAMAAGLAGGGAADKLFEKDFVINDDLIVDGSACIGFDCVNGESFGFDTIRLKENNLRIKFDDTSVAASFPRNDWQLTANDSANGGASKFSIDDISGNRTPFTVEANARSHSLYVDDGGRIGNRTSTPSTEIHTIDGDTPTLRLQQDGSSGFAPQTWDVAGNETNFFIRDVTNGSTLPFRIRPGASSSAIFIDVNSNVGFKTSSPAEAVHVLRTDASATKIQIENSNAAAQVTGFELINSAESWSVRNGANGHFVIREVGGDVIVDIDPSNNQVTLAGNLVTGGGGTCDPGPCDGTFIDYEVESIEDHASYMWENKHLWGVGPTPDGAPINISQKTTGILHELEKAHIYIEQLNGTIKELSTRLAALEAQQGN